MVCTELMYFDLLKAVVYIDSSLKFEILFKKDVTHAQSFWVTFWYMYHGLNGFQEDGWYRSFSSGIFRSEAPLWALLYIRQSLTYSYYVEGKRRMGITEKIYCIFVLFLNRIPVSLPNGSNNSKFQPIFIYICIYSKRML